MIGTFVRWVLVVMALAPAAASAEPVKLKLSLISSDRSLIYLVDVKPFVDAVKAEAKGLLEIEIYFSGALGKSATQQMPASEIGALIFKDFHTALLIKCNPIKVGRRSNKQAVER